MELLTLLAFDETDWGDGLLSGFSVTLRLALATLPVGLCIGLAIASAQLACSRAVRQLGRSCVVLFRGIPELLTLFLVYNGVGLLLNSAAKALDPESGFVELSPFGAGMVALGLVFGAYAAEVLRWLSPAGQE